MDYKQKAQELFAKVYAADMAAYEAELARQKEFEEQKILPVIELANKGDVDTILQLKELAKEGNDKAKDALEKLYWDSNKETAVGTVVLREGITRIKDFEFKECKRLEKIVLPDSLTAIGNGAFYGCTSLKKIHIPDNGKSCIGLGHFKDCPDNAKIISSKFWDSVGVKTLADFRNLKKVILPDSLTKISYGAFSGCTSLKEINLPDSLTAIGDGAFYGCHHVMEITYP